MLTVGHGRLGRHELGALLTGAGVEQVVDVRRYPGSRSNEDSRREALEKWLPTAGLGYRWEADLGGRRRLTTEQEAQNPDTWWRVAQFRAYAAYTRTLEFTAALARLLDQAGGARTAVLCSESVWWRCHRRIVADAAVLAHGVPVCHLMPQGRLVEHPVSEGARVDGASVVWDGPR